MTRKRIDIEQLVIWAYRDQMVQAARREGLPVEIARHYTPSLRSIDLERERVSSSERVDFEAPHDAYVVHAEVLKLGVVPRHFTDEEREIVIARAMANNEVFGIGHGGRRAQEVIEGQEARERAAWERRSRRAGVVMPPVQKLSLTNTVFYYGQLGRRPEWHPHPEYRFERGKPVYRGRDKRSFFHLLRNIGDDPLEIERDRSTYSHWREALETVRKGCAEDLERFEVSNQLPPSTPWSQQIP